MNKVIEVTNCRDCPFFAYMKDVPVCTHKDRITNVAIVGDGETIHDRIKPIAFPDWCPLEDTDSYAESNFDIDNEPN